MARNITTLIERDTCIPMLIAALFTMARTCKQPRCPLADEWIRKCGTYWHNGILLSYKKKHIWVSSNEVDEMGAYPTEWTKSERETQILYMYGI